MKNCPTLRKSCKRPVWLNSVQEVVGHGPLELQIIAAVVTTDMYIIRLDSVPPIHAEWYLCSHQIRTPLMATSSGLFLATIYNQSQPAERKHVGWSTLWQPLIGHRPTAAYRALFVFNSGHFAKNIEIEVSLYGGSIMAAVYCPCGRHSFYHVQCDALMTSSSH